MADEYRIQPAHDVSQDTFRFSQITFLAERKRNEKGRHLQTSCEGGAGGKVMRENKHVLPVFSVCERKIILEKGEFLSEKRQPKQ